MWQPKEINIKNLMTHKDTTFIFKKNECQMIFGINSTDSGTNSNGGGKSTILEGITLALTNETNRGITKDDFISDGEDSCVIDFSLYNPVGDVNDLRIERTFFKGSKSAKIKIWENNELNKNLTSVNEANKRIYELIGLNKEDLIHFFIIGQETSYSFLTANDTDKKSIISRFSDIDFIERKINKLIELRKLDEKTLQEFNRKLDKSNDKIEFYEEQILEIKEESDNSSKIKKLKQKIKKLEESKIEKESKIDSYKTEISHIKIEIKSIEIFDLKDLKNNLNKKIEKKKKYELEILEQEHNSKHLQLILDGQIICPNCKVPFNPTERDLELSEIPSLINEIKLLTLELKKKIKKLSKGIDLIKEQLSDNDKSIDLKNDLKNKSKSLKNRIISCEEDIEIIKDDIIETNKSIKKEKKIDSSADKISKIKENISLEKESISELEEKIEKINNLILDYDFWIFHFGKKGFTTYLTNKSIKSIEGVTNSYLSKMNSDLQLSIEGFTVLKSGELREKISIEIIRNGLESSNFQRYSGGERGRIKLANILGLQHLINLTAKNGGLNFLGLDEVFEGLDQTGQVDIINILENLKVTSLVITHRNQPIGASNEIFIEKSNGVSKLISKDEYYERTKID